MTCSLKLLFLLFGISCGYLIENEFDEINTSKIFANKIKAYLLEKNNISTACKAHLLEYVKGLLSKEKWALKMFDATAKVPSGIAEGNLVDLGAFDECLKIKEKLTAEKTITGKYCLGAVTISKITNKRPQQLIRNFEVVFGIREPRVATETGEQLGIRLATCMPDVCSNTDLQEVYGIFHLNLTLNEELCQSKANQPKLDAGAIAALSFFGVILWIIIASTVYDVMIFYLHKRPFHPMLIAFSVVTNGKKLLATSNGPNQISCLHGLRVISTMWVILGHRYAIQNGLPTKNLLYLFEWFNHQANMFILGATVSVDTFFLIAGLVISYMYMNAMQKGKFNIALYYVHRYLRLTPALAVVVLIHATLLQHLGSGPIWPLIKPKLITSCENYWWRALLYIQNYGDLNMCIPQSWYLCVDTQLFVLSPILLIPLKRWPKMTLLTTGFLTVCSIISCFLTAWFFELNGSMLANSRPDAFGNYMKYYYLATWTRAAPWLMGIVLGYFIFKSKQEKVVFVNKVFVLCLWTISLAVLCTCVFAGHALAIEEYNKLKSSFYVALVRPAWSAALAWIIFACVTGYGGPVNWFLSLPIFQVVSKFTYSLYLVHYTLIYLTTVQMRTPPTITNAREMYIFWGDFAFASAVAVILTLAFESPIITIEKCIFGYTEKKQQTQSPITENGKKSSEIA